MRYSEHRICALTGGMPEAFLLDADNRRAWCDSYRITFRERDLRRLSAITSVPQFARVTSLAFLRSAGQIRLLQPFFTNVGKRLVKSPRLFAVDSGAAAWAANVYD